MNFPFYIAKRYLFSKSSSNTINIITFIAGIGVVIGTAALFIVLSGFSGLKTFSLSFLNTSDPDLKIIPVKGKRFTFDNQIQNILEDTPGVVAYTKVIEERAFFEYKNKSHLGIIKGIEENFTTINPIDSTIYIGDWINFEFENQVAIGRKLSNRLSLGLNDYLNPIKIYVPKSGKGYVSSIKNDINYVLTNPVGIFSLTEDIDDKYIFGTTAMAQKLLGYESNQISSIEIKTQNKNLRNQALEYLNNNLGAEFKVKTREQLNAVFYKMLNTENLASYLIFTLILIIALFNVIGALIMMIYDKKDNLKTLFNLGANIKDIQRIFLLQGILLTLIGMSIGLIVSVVLVLLQKQYGLFMITTTLPYPIEFKISNLIAVIITIVTLGYLASKLACSRITEKRIES